MKRYQPIAAAAIDWNDDIPHNCKHDDIYFSNAGGLAETRHVFLQGNQLPQRWLKQTYFCIAETGFGTGLNFLCTIHEWLTTAPDNAHLEYISAEKHPLTQLDLQRVVRLWPELHYISTELFNHYPPLAHGLHQRNLFNGRVTLNLLFGDATDMYSKLDTNVDAWYLDGFSPGKNPDMWSPELFQQIARLTVPDGSIATFSAAGIVRRGLTQAGFKVSTQPGFGRKRDMTVGHLTTPVTFQHQQPWFESPNSLTDNKQAIVIGAGLAGCTISHTLAQRGWQISLIERNTGIAQEASGNLAGVVMPRLTADMSTDGRFYLSAFFHTAHWLNQLKYRDSTLPWFQSGVLQLCDAQQQQRMQKLGLSAEILELCNADSASRHCGTTVGGGLFFPGGGWLEPPALCQWLLDDQRDCITTQLNQTALRLERINKLWHVISETGTIATAETVIIANGHDVERLLQTDIFKLQRVRGQLAYLAANSETRRLKTPVCYHGYIIPHYKNQHCAGASYNNDDDSLEPNSGSKKHILTALAETLPGFDIPKIISDRVAFRTSTQDHLPLIGPVPDIEFYNQHYANLHHGKPVRDYPNATYLPNLFISTGHGSRGLISCHFAAEAIAAHLGHGTSCMDRQLARATHPARFLIRQFSRR